MKNIKNLIKPVQLFNKTTVINGGGGIAFTFIIALLGYGLAKLPGFDHMGQLASAIVIAVLYRQLFGYPAFFRLGIAFSSQSLLRFAIVLFGLKLNMATVIQDGAGLLMRDTGVIIFAILTTIWLARLFKADITISLLLGVGTGVCGAAAIAAIAPIIKSKEEDTAISVGIIALFGTVFAITYTVLRPFLPLTSIEYGIWSGISLHEIAHVALASAPAGKEALAIGLLAKLGRVFLLIPLCFLFMYIIKLKSSRDEHVQTKIGFPWFLIGFIIMSILGSYVLGDAIPVSSTFTNGVSNLSSWCLTAAMVGLGLNVNLQDLRAKALKPMVVMVIVSICLSVLTYFIV
ncbi:putative sulfate exporter family transporter [Gracilibacillus caseinilyticus]|uniref:Sulfate exporter family transporter n=1 Tax=Gracilibacillus caseinilyticus TaxID=2932256 RepID=A0ABY4F1Q9_9BACI|nr:putative sulfate exporter family transporter [Gracilibacillus caseinilyticus]UOQ50419.1 putative sulfate exporter family transporter [Gracilibacillus caseinilyticus]